MKTKISPEGFILLQDKIMEARNYGHSEDYAAAYGLLAVGLPMQKHDFEVDYEMTGKVFPFMDHYLPKRQK